MNFCALVRNFFKIKLFNCSSNIQNVWTENVENNQFLFSLFLFPMHSEKLKFMEPSRVWYQVNPPNPPTIFVPLPENHLMPCNVSDGPWIFRTRTSLSHKPARDWFIRFCTMHLVPSTQTKLVLMYGMVDGVVVSLFTARLSLFCLVSL